MGRAGTAIQVGGEIPRSRRRGRVTSYGPVLAAFDKLVLGAKDGKDRFSDVLVVEKDEDPADAMASLRNAVSRYAREREFGATMSFSEPSKQKDGTSIVNYGVIKVEKRPARPRAPKAEGEKKNTKKKAA